MNMQTHPPAASPRLSTLAAMIEAFERDDIEAAVDMLIERLDQRDGDADLEDDDRAGVLMTSRGVDFDPDAAPPPPDGHPGDPEDAEEDDEPEDDDPAGGNVTDEPHDTIDDDMEVEDRAETRLRMGHRDRIRRTRCHHVRVGRVPYGWTEYQLKEGSRR